MNTRYGEIIEVIQYPTELCVQCESRLKMKTIWLTHSEALELAAELVKLAMPEATKGQDNATAS